MKFLQVNPDLGELIPIQSVLVNLSRGYWCEFFHTLFRFQVIFP